MGLSRTKNSIRNTFFAASAYVIKVLMQFIVRAVFIRYFAAEYLGIHGLFLNVLNVLSLAELGVGNAIVYSMYKPVAQNDTEKIKSLLRLYRNLYFVIACVVIVIGLSLVPLLPKLVKDAPDIDVNLTYAYLLFLAQSVVGYFFAYRRSLVFAYQRNDIESKVSLVTQVALAVAQVLLIVFTRNFYAYTAALVAGSAVDAVAVFVISYKLFPEIRGKAKKLEKQDVKEISKNAGAMLCHKLGAAAVQSTDSIIISAFIGAAILGKYSNYTLVTGALGSIVNLLMTALKGSVGNMMSERTPADVYRIYKALYLAFMWFLSFMFIGALVCFQDFIAVYAGSADYVLEMSTVILICVSFYVTFSRYLVIAFKECSGLFWNDRYKPLFEAGINLTLDFILVRYMGINGVFLATIISTVVVPLWVEPFVLYKNYFKKSVWRYIAKFCLHTAITAIIAIATYFVCDFIAIAGVSGFLLKFVICLILPNVLFFVAYFRSAELKYLLSVAKGLLHRA